MPRWEERTLRGRGNARRAGLSPRTHWQEAPGMEEAGCATRSPDLLVRHVCISVRGGSTAGRSPFFPITDSENLISYVIRMCFRLYV